MNKAVVIPYEELSSHMQRVQRQGGKIASKTGKKVARTIDGRNLDGLADEEGGRGGVVGVVRVGAGRGDLERDRLEPEV